MINYQIIALPAFQDNYIWLIHNDRFAIVIDPGSADVVDAYLVKNKLTLQTILLTHSHDDHIGGVSQLQETYALSVIDNFKFQLLDNQIIDLPNFPSLQVLITPGHLMEHVCYLFADKHLFCADTLFSLGCGRVFTNDFKAMHNSLNKIKSLSPQTLCYPAHEYTMTNLRFTLSIDSDHEYYRNYADKLTARLASAKNTLPVLLGDELKHNLFLRCDDPKVWSMVEAKSGKIIHSAYECFLQLRLLRNDFKF